VTLQRNIESHLRDLLTLEVTTVVVSEIPPEIVQGLRGRIESLERGLTQGTEAKKNLGERFMDLARSMAKGELPPLEWPSDGSAPDQDRMMAMAQLMHGMRDVDELPPEKWILTTLGHHPIALHTTISVSGDLVTLVAEKYTKDEKKAIRDVHAEGIRHAVGFWTTIGEFAVSGLNVILGALVGKLQDPK
jgi:hypothetical protein